ncbi:hypothetical protein HNP86_001929 [Methanococcus maripaludis]|uniref:Uncharacterized protein n=1 Tax=Methanococcus maripaludis TaxID=39152 RepID=A0A7J9NVR5_METMI|nr:hypothetical protein [Methanococcus maripaludis]MBA2851770.1 hypothetical protein [Methanococcus maripaludis]
MKFTIGKNTTVYGKNILPAGQIRPGDKIIGIDIGQLKPMGVRVKSVTPVKGPAIGIGLAASGNIVGKKSLTHDGIGPLKIIEDNIHIFKSKRPIPLKETITQIKEDMDLVTIELEDANCAGLVSKALYIVFDDVNESPMQEEPVKFSEKTPVDPVEPEVPEQEPEESAADELEPQTPESKTEKNGKKPKSKK